MADNLPHLPLPAPERQPHSVVTGRTDPEIPDRDPRAHSGQLASQLDALEGSLARIDLTARPADARGFLYAATFAKDSDARIASLGDKETGNTVVDFNSESGRALVYTPRPTLSALRSKIAEYGDPEDLTKTGKPRNLPLVAPLETLGSVSLVDLSDGWLRQDALPESEWVELWIGGGQLGDPAERERRRRALAEFVGRYGRLQDAVVSGDLHAFTATEHDIYLLKLPEAALRALPLQLPEVFHLGPPQRSVVPQMLELQKDDLLIPEVGQVADEATTVAILDTGVAEAHPLLAPLMVGPGSSSIAGDQSSGDSYGHGTKMAGLAAYRDLADGLAGGAALSPRCRLQNVRIFDGKEHADPDPMLERTRDAVLEAEQIAVSRRVFAMSIGAETSQPSASTLWSVAVDRLVYAGGGRLFCVAAGNVPVKELPKPGDYPTSNLTFGLASPGEAVNALTVGAITDLTVMDPGADGRSPVAAAGQLSPSSRCDVGGNRPIKPDLVFEGGNLSADAMVCRQDRAMQLLTTCREHAIGPWLTTASMTSAATAKVAGLAAEVWQENPSRRPETIRGLLVHAARWTPAMRSQFPNSRDLYRAVGYGTPSADSARWSERDRPTVIFEGKIHPLRKLPLTAGEKKGKKGREMHFHKLPLPDQELEALADSELELTVTLSYFAQPNETRGVRYLSAQLRWEMQRPFESEPDFRKRINKLERAEGEKFKSGAERIKWDIGGDLRNRGTVQSDRTRVPATDLVGSPAIAVWPVGGWWTDRKLKGDPALHYSLIVTLDAGGSEVDLYTPIENKVTVLV
jgi:hypothetical protein